METQNAEKKITSTHTQRKRRDFLEIKQSFDVWSALILQLIVLGMKYSQNSTLEHCQHSPAATYAQVEPLYVRDVGFFEDV